MFKQDYLLSHARDSFKRERFAEALQMCDKIKAKTKETRYQVAIMRGEIYLALGDVSNALASFESVAEDKICDARVDLGRGLSHFELGQFPESLEALQKAVKRNSKLAEAHQTLGLIFELLEEGNALECFQKATELDPDRFPQTRIRTNQNFRRVIDEAILGLEFTLQNKIKEVPIIILPLPLLNENKELQPRISPKAFAMLRFDTDDNQYVLFVFKRTIERAFKERADMVAALTHLLHEYF